MSWKIHCEYTRMVSVGELSPHPKNPKKHTEEAIDRQCKVMDYQGWRRPITVSNLSGKMTAGHKRLLAAKLRGEAEVPVSFQDYESEEQEIADLVADNALNEWEPTDLAAVNALIPDLDPGFDIDWLGIKDFVLEPAEKYEGDEDEVPQAPTEPTIKRGELWILGNHRLLCGDCTVKENVDRLMGGEKADMVFTDPPYGVDYSGGTFGDRRKLEGDTDARLYEPAAKMVNEFVDGPAYFWFSSNKGLCVLEAVEAVEAVGELKALLIWHKTNATYGNLNAHYKIRFEPCLYWKPESTKNMRWVGPTDECTLWEIKKDGLNEFHPTQKPVALAERAIRNHDAPRVLDLFLGSGSTLIACEKTNRRCFGCEIDEHYSEVIIQRWMKYTGKMAYREDGVSFESLKGNLAT